jgi:hypothetical protein
VLFWTPHLTAVESGDREADRGSEPDVDQAARLFAMVNVIAADGLIGCIDGTYHYPFWRPLLAVPQGDTDGNPRRAQGPT